MANGGDGTQENPLYAPDTNFHSAAYREAIVMSDRASKVTGTITLRSGEVLAFHDNHISAGSLSISSTMVCDDYYISGAVPSSELTVSLLLDIAAYQLYGADILLSYWLQIGEDEWYEVPLGKYTISSIENTSDSGLTITANDAAMKFGEVPFDSLGFVGETLYMSSDIVYICAKSIGIEVAQSPSEILALSPLRGYRLGYADGSIETARDLLMHLAQVIGCFIYVNRWGKLEVVPLKPREPYITISDGVRASSSFSKLVYQLKNLTYNVQKYDVTNRRYLKGKTNDIRSIGVSVPLADNPLWSIMRGDEKDWNMLFFTSVSWLQTQLEYASYHPVSVDWYGDPAVTLGDWIAYTGGRLGDETVVSPVTSFTWTYHGTQTINACGREAIAEIAKSQKDKSLDALTENQITYADEVMERVRLRQMQTYMGIRNFTYNEVSKYTYEQIRKGEK